MTPSFKSFRPLAAGLFSAAIGLAWPLAARAQTPSVPHPHAYGIIVGNNTGGPGQTALRYAEDDATRMADVLRDVGRFGTTDLRVLAHPDGPKILATIDEVGQKVRENQQRGEQSVVVFYYSGHAKANAFTLGDGELPLATLRERLRQMPSTLTLVVLDACQSGAFARTKGAEPAADFSFNSVSHLTTKGIAVMASSTGQELSQESDSLKSSYFTHHLIVALRGAGDADGDGRVSLDEAYRYAYRRTLAATARTRVGTQHVTLETDLQKAPGAALRLALPSGQYDATLRTKGKAMSCHLALTDGRVTAIDLGACNEVAASGIAKGDTDDEMAFAASEPAREPDHANATAPSATPLREIDRWGVEATTGLLWRSYDAYTQRLDDFG